MNKTLITGVVVCIIKYDMILNGYDREFFLKVEEDEKGSESERIGWRAPCK